MKLKKTTYKEVKDSFLVANVLNKKRTFAYYLLFGAIFTVIIIISLYFNTAPLDMQSIVIACCIGIVLTAFMSIPLLFKNKSKVGIHQKGIWIHTNENNDLVGFIEWGWIKDIQISEKDQILYITVYDYKAIKKTNTNFLQRWNVATNGNEKALMFSLGLFSPILDKIIDCIIENNFAEIKIIE